MRESEAEFLAHGTAGAKASGRGSRVHLGNSGQVVVAGAQGRAEESCLLVGSGGGWGQIVEAEDRGLWGHGMTFGIYFERKWSLIKELDYV